MRVLLAASLILMPSVSFANELCAVYKPLGGVAHKSADDVNLNSFEFNMPEKVVVPISKDFAESLEVDLDMTSNLGVVEIYSNGRVVFEGQEVSSQAQSYCERTVNEDGQEGAEAINSETSEEVIEEE